MIALQKPIAVLSVTLLLLGNLAGWVHVHQVADTGVRAGQVSVTSHCHHHGCSASHHHPSSESQAADRSNGKQDSSPAAPHDPEHCSVCRLIYTLRQAADLSTDLDLTHFEPLVVQSVQPHSVSVVSQWFSRPLSSRGPPLV